MKAFVVLALVACVAARSVDVDTLRLLSKEKSLLSRDDLLLKDKLFSNTHRFSTFPRKSLQSFDYTTPSVYGDLDVDVNSWTSRRVTVLSFEELVSTDLFREYLQIPLFRQALEQYPTVFRRYLESVLFQQFWTVPEFQTYFKNVYLFKKFIVPQIQVVAQTTTVIPTEETLDYGYDSQDLPIYGRQNQEVTVGDYLARIFGHGVERSTVYPGTTFNKYNRYNPIFGGRQFGGLYNTFNTNTDNVNYKFLLDKIYRTLFLNKPVYGENTQVRTDVKISPIRKEFIVEPLTGELKKVVVEEPKIVDVKVDEKIVPTTRDVDVETNVVLKEALLKRLLITKHITPELYQVLRTLPYHHVVEIVRKIVPTFGDRVDVDSIFDDVTPDTLRYDVDTVYPTIRDVDVDETKVVLKESLLKRLLINKHITPELYQVLRTLPYHKVIEIIRKIVPSVVDRVDVDSTIFGDVDNVDVNDIVYRQKMNNIVDRLVNKVDRYNSPDVTRDLLKTIGQRNVISNMDEIVRP